MKEILLSVYASCMLLISGASAQKTICLWDPAADKAQPFSLHDTQQLQVIVFLSPECPLCRNYTLTLNQLRARYEGRVIFTGIIPGKAYTADDVKDFARKYKITFPVYIDSGKIVSSALQATVTPEVFLLRGENKIYYHGAIDNWLKELGMQSARPTKYYLRDAIDETLQHIPVRISFNKPVGCLINDY